jgi:hypothetical protein
MPELSDLLKINTPATKAEVTNEEIVEKPDGFFRKTTIEKPITAEVIKNEIAILNKKIVRYTEELKNLNAQNEAKLSQIEQLGK